MIPEASEDEAEPAVCPMFTSRMVPLPMTFFMVAKTATMITARGIDVLIVKPDFQSQVGVGRSQDSAEDNSEDQSSPGPVSH